MSSGDNAERALTEITSKVLERLQWAGFLDGRRYDSVDRDYRDDYEWMNPFPYPRPSLMHSLSLSDAGNSLSRLALTSTAASSTPKSSEAEVAFQLNQVAYKFMKHFDDKDFAAMKNMMTSNVKLPKGGYKPDMDMDDCSEESLEEYIGNLKSAYPQGKLLDTNHHIGASFLQPGSGSERIANYQVKIVQSRYNKGSDWNPARTQLEKRDTALIEVILCFKQAKDKKEWKVAGMAGSIKWIGYSKPKQIITGSTEMNASRKHIVANVLRYHRIDSAAKSLAAHTRHGHQNGTSYHNDMLVTRGRSVGAPRYHGGHSSHWNPLP